MKAGADVNKVSYVHVHVGCEEVLHVHVHVEEHVLQPCHAHVHCVKNPILPCTCMYMYHLG